MPTPLGARRYVVGPAPSVRAKAQFRDDRHRLGAALSPVASADKPWMWASGHGGHIERAAHGYEPTREAAMAAFAKSWRRQ